jgi:SRSO17 transposase
MAGLLAPLPVENCWTIAEHAGDDGPGGMQDLIGRASWDDAGVRADVRDSPPPGSGIPTGVLSVDETGDLKRGTHTVVVPILDRSLATPPLPSPPNHSRHGG